MEAGVSGQIPEFESELLIITVDSCRDCMSSFCNPPTACCRLKRQLGNAGACLQVPARVALLPRRRQHGNGPLRRQGRVRARPHCAQVPQHLHIVLQLEYWTWTQAGVCRMLQYQQQMREIYIAFIGQNASWRGGCSKGQPYLPPTQVTSTRTCSSTSDASMSPTMETSRLSERSCAMMASRMPSSVSASISSGLGSRNRLRGFVEVGEVETSSSFVLLNRHACVLQQDAGP